MSGAEELRRLHDFQAKARESTNCLDAAHLVMQTIWESLIYVPKRWNWWGGAWRADEQMVNFYGQGLIKCQNYMLALQLLSHIYVSIGQKIEIAKTYELWEQECQNEAQRREADSPPSNGRRPLLTSMPDVLVEMRRRAAEHDMKLKEYYTRHGQGNSSMGKSGG